MPSLTVAEAIELLHQDAKRHQAGQPGPLVGVIMGSDSDSDVMDKAVDVLVQVNVTHEVRIVSAHRTPELMFAYAQTAKRRGLKVIVAGAGGSAHLPGMVAAITPIPVIGVPILSSNSISGIDSMLSMISMPKGHPVATVGIDAAANAAILALKILALSDESIAEQLAKYLAKH